MTVDFFLEKAANVSVEEIKRISDEAQRENRIPKIVHMCFFNWKELTKNEPEYIPLLQSWIDVLIPQGYTFINWTKDKLPETHFLNLALANKKWAFGADYARIYGLYTYGGIWMDCDVVVFKDFDDFLDLPYMIDCEYSMFVTGDKRERIEAGIMGCRKNWGFFKPVLDFYNEYKLDTMNLARLCLPFLINEVTTEAGYKINFNYGNKEKYRDYFKTHSGDEKEIITMDCTYFSKTEMNLPHNAINIRSAKVVSHSEPQAYTAHQLFDKWCDPTIISQEENQKNNDLQIYCLTHKGWDLPNDLYHTPIQVGAALNTDKDICVVKDSIGESISKENPYYWELTGIYWIWKNVNDVKYVGHDHYRRRWNMQPEALLKLLEEHPVIFPKGIRMLPNIYDYFGSFHSSRAIKSMEEVIRESYPELSEGWDKYIKNGAIFYRCNSFIARKDIYDEICEFIFGALSKFREKEGLYTPEDINNYVRKYSIHYLPDNHIVKDGWGWETYQRALFAFLSERLLTLYAQAKLIPFWTVELKDLEANI